MARYASCNNKNQVEYLGQPASPEEIAASRKREQEYAARNTNTAKGSPQLQPFADAANQFIKNKMDDLDSAVKECDSRKAKKYAKGGTVRGGGIESRGKTRGRFR